mgnify:CR=1 FL=1|jgi:hypothetical protein
MGKFSKIHSKKSPFKQEKFLDKVKSKVTGKVAGKAATKGASKLGLKTLAKGIPVVGAASTAKEGFDFLERKQVGQKSVKNIGKSSGRTFLGKA